MPGELDRFLAEVREESKEGGSQAVADFEAYRHHYELSRQLLELRSARGWSQVDLARQSGVQQSEISRIERGQGNPTYQTLTALAGAMSARLAFIPAAAGAVVRRQGNRAKPKGSRASTRRSGRERREVHA